MITRNKIKPNNHLHDQPLRIVKGWRTLKYIINDDEPGMRYRYDRVPNLPSKDYLIYTSLRMITWLLVGGYILAKLL